MAKKSTPAASKKRRIIQKEIFVLDIFVSVVVAPRGDEGDKADFVEYVRELSDMLFRAYSNYEIIVVDNQMPGEYIELLSTLLAELPCLRIIRLSRRHTHDMAIMAGLESTIGDHIVVTDPALDPIKSIPSIVEQNQVYDIVQGVAKPPKGKKSIRMTLSRRLFYQYSRRHMMIDVPTNATYFMALSRRATSALTSSTRRDTHVRFMIRTIGYMYYAMPYQVQVNPVRNRSLRVGILEAADIVSSYSVHPLRFMSWLGLFASILSIFYAAYVIYITITQQHVAEGWTTMSLQISGLFFILFLIIVVLSEYISKLLVESRRDPKYHVIDELVSTVALVDTGRKNISND